MAYLTESGLRAYTPTRENLAKSLTEHRRGKPAGAHSVFLSHSHLDKELVGAAMKYLEKQNASVYVDWLDDALPAVPSPVTAAHVREAIGRNTKFILLATENSLDSAWVPWELGLADGLKGFARMAVLPVISDGGRWRGNEYVGLYSTVETGGSGAWGVFPPNSSKGQLLSAWLSEP